MPYDRPVVKSTLEISPPCDSEKITFEFNKLGCTQNPSPPLIHLQSTAVTPPGAELGAIQLLLSCNPP